MLHLTWVIGRVHKADRQLSRLEIKQHGVSAPDFLRSQPSKPVDIDAGLVVIGVIV